jgi:ABC-type transport system involved in multi-copper enzyme maturation permease subunit
MNAARAIAWNTFLEAVREKVLYLLAGFAIAIVIVSRLLAPLALGEGRRVTIDFGLMALSVIGLLVIVFVGHSLVYRELERGSVGFLFSRPVSRGAFVIGKYAGLSLVLALAVAGMGITLALVLFASGYRFGLELAGALFFSLLELWILAAVAMLFASVASPVLAGLFVVGAWWIGNGAESLGQLASSLPLPAIAEAARALLWVVPRLDLYDGAGWLVRGAGPDPATWAWALAYAGLYVTGVLLLARAAFARRSLVG